MAHLVLVHLTSEEGPCDWETKPLGGGPAHWCWCFQSGHFILLVLQVLENCKLDFPAVIKIIPTSSVCYCRPGFSLFHRLSIWHRSPCSYLRYKVKRMYLVIISLLSSLEQLQLPKRIILDREKKPTDFLVCPDLLGKVSNCNSQSQNNLCWNSEFSSFILMQL